MNLLLLDLRFNIPQGAGETRTYDLARAVVEAGHSVTVACGSCLDTKSGLSVPFLRGRREGEVDGVRVIELELPPEEVASGGYGRAGRRRAQRFARWIRSLRREIQPDAVAVRNAPILAVLPVLRWKRRHGIPFVLEVAYLVPEIPAECGGVTNGITRSLMIGLEWWMYRKADAIVTFAPGARAGVLQREVPPDKVHLLPAACGVTPAHAPSFPWRPDGVGVGDFVVVVPTTNDHTQDLDIVLDAAVELRRRGEHGLRMVLVGVREGRPALERRIREEHLHAVVLAPSLSAEERPALLAGADVGLITAANIPSFYQGLPWPVFYECLAAGLPVVTNLPGWHGEAIEDARCGYTVLPNQPKLLADALQQARKAGRDARQTLGERARRLGQQIAPEGSHYRKELELLEEVGRRLGKEG